MKYLPALLVVLALTGYGCQTYESETGCQPRCNNRECGDDGCGGSCGECQDHQKCEAGVCTQPPCCPGHPDYTFHVSVSGRVVDLTTMKGVRASLQPVSPMDALTSPDHPCITCNNWWESDEDGYFAIPCQDVTEVALGVVIAADDLRPDAAQGTYFPTGVMATWWHTNDEKRCVYDARVYAVPNTVVRAAEATTSVDSANYGMVAGLVVDDSFNAVEGAVIKMGDGSDLVEVIYPDASFTAFNGKATSKHGAFILPHTNFAPGIIEITAEKDGMSFGLEQAAPKAGLCFFVIIETD